MARPLRTQRGTPRRNAPAAPRPRAPGTSGQPQPSIVELGAGYSGQMLLDYLERTLLKGLKCTGDDGWGEDAYFWNDFWYSEPQGDSEENVLLTIWTYNTEQEEPVSPMDEVAVGFTVEFNHPGNGPGFFHRFKG